MRNLAGVATATDAVIDELSAIGAELVPVPARGEVPARIAGRMRLGGGRTVTLTRAWAYWVATCDPPIPAADAHAINERHGGSARAYGYAGGMDRERLAEWTRRGGVDVYHVDTPAALAAFVAALRALYGTPPTGGTDGR